MQAHTPGVSGDEAITAPRKLFGLIPTNGYEEPPEKGHWISIIKMQGKFLHQSNTEP